METYRKATTRCIDGTHRSKHLRDEGYGWERGSTETRGKNLKGAVRAVKRSLGMDGCMKARERGESTTEGNE